MFDRIRSAKAGPWVIGLAIAFLAVALLVIGALYSHVYESVYQDYAASKDRAEIQRKLQEKCAAITAVEELRNCFEQQIEAGTKTRQSQEDLYAQKQMAQWAFWSFVVAGAIGVLSLAVGAIGIFFVRQTLEAANKTNRIMLTEQRPWVTIDRQIQCDFSLRSSNGGTARWTYHLNNRGKLPAHHVSLHQKVIRYGDYHQAAIQFSEFVQSARRNAGVSGTVIFPEVSVPSERAFDPAARWASCSTRFDDRHQGDRHALLVCVTYEQFIDVPEMGIDAQMYDIRADARFPIGPGIHRLVSFAAERIIE